MSDDCDLDCAGCRAHVTGYDVNLPDCLAVGECVERLERLNDRYSRSVSDTQEQAPDIRS